MLSEARADVSSALPPRKDARTGPKEISPRFAADAETAPFSYGRLLPTVSRPTATVAFALADIAFFRVRLAHTGRSPERPADHATRTSSFRLVPSQMEDRTLKTGDVAILQVGLFFAVRLVFHRIFRDEPVTADVRDPFTVARRHAVEA